MRVPEFSPGEDERAFTIGLFEEHLEEAAFLYEQRRGLYEDPEVTWLAIEPFEDRLEAHLDALASGDSLAGEVCERQGRDGGPGELYAAVCVFCRQQRRDLLGSVLKALDADAGDRFQAVTDAIRDEMPSEWVRTLAGNLERGHEKLAPIVADYVGHHRLSIEGIFEGLVDSVPPTGLARVVSCMGRLHVSARAPQIMGLVRHEAAAVRTSAAIALLRRGDLRMLDLCREQARHGDAAMWLPLAVSGRRTDAEILQRAALAATPSRDALMALGVLGELSAVRLLLEKLNDPDLAATAATALHLITGADVREDTFVPDAVDEDELFEDERQTYRDTGEGPTRSDGLPFGVNVQRVSRNPEQWRDWLEDHKSEFDATQRYRLGKPVSPRTLVETLVAASCNRQIRSLAYEELVIRYGIDARFETEMRVIDQKRQINALGRLCRASEASFSPGGWYFAKELA